MNKFFSLLRREVEGKNLPQNIKEITEKIAIDAGYHRELCKRPHTKTRFGTFYDKPFDNCLTAAWFLHFEKLFVGKLHRQFVLKEYQVDIINDTFKAVMDTLDLDKVINDNTINRLVSLTLVSRIVNKLRLLGFDSKFHSKTGGINPNKESIMTTYSIETSIENGHDLAVVNENNDVFIDLKHKLKNNPIGNDILMYLVSTHRYTSLRTLLKDFMINANEYQISKDKLKEYVTSAFLDIKNVLLSYHPTVPINIREAIKKSKFEITNREII